MSMSYSKYNWSVLSKDYNSPFFRNYIWTKAFFYYDELFGITRPIAGAAGKSGDLEYLTDQESWLQFHKDIRSKVAEDVAFVDQIIEMANRFGEEMNAWTEKEIFLRDVRDLDDSSLVNLYNHFFELQAKEYAIGLAVTVLDYQEYVFVEGSLNAYLEKHVPVDERAEAYRLFTYPSRPSFAEYQEMDLLSSW